MENLHIKRRERKWTWKGTAVAKLNKSPAVNTKSSKSCLESWLQKKRLCESLYPTAFLAPWEPIQTWNSLDPQGCTKYGHTSVKPAAEVIGNKSRTVPDARQVGSGSRNHSLTSKRWSNSELLNFHWAESEENKGGEMASFFSFTFFFFLLVAECRLSLNKQEAVFLRKVSF